VELHVRKPLRNIQSWKQYCLPSWNTGNPAAANHLFCNQQQNLFPLYGTQGAFIWVHKIEVPQNRGISPLLGFRLMVQTGSNSPSSAALEKIEILSEV
jgi:hypothetical protein